MNNKIKTALLLVLLAVLVLVFAKYTLPRKHNIVRGLVLNAWRLSNLRLDRPALALYNIAAAIEPNYYQTYVFRGDTYLTLQNYQRAEEDFIRTLELNPGDRHARESLNMLYTINNDFKRAIDGYEKMVKVDPLQADYYYYQMGSNYLYLKDYNNALLALEKVQNPKPKYSNVFIQKAFIYLATHEYELAESECQKAIALDPSQQDNLASMLDVIRTEKERYRKNLVEMDLLKNSLTGDPSDADKYTDM
ncbi:MAG: tetratricopeptide repeat protein, partial [Deltaproteobacteria bacterium]|nr:tetratricopeptide repeat protein [Deltaproteobacteria bacterium]